MKTHLKRTIYSRICYSTLYAPISILFRLIISCLFFSLLFGVPSQPIPIILCITGNNSQFRAIGGQFDSSCCIVGGSHAAVTITTGISTIAIVVAIVVYILLIGQALPS